jgi:O-methyltransferase
MWLKNRNIQKLGGGRLERLGLNVWSKLQLAGLKSRKPSDIVELISQIHKEQRSLLSAFELFYLYSLSRAQAAAPGVFAEVGVYQGGSAKLICQAKGNKSLRLFDTFEGLPQPSDHDRGVHKKGQYACPMEAVQSYLSGYLNVTFHKGTFPDSVKNLEEESYSFVHFDVDLYAGTLACLEYFYPRMAPGGMMLSHDYDLLAGVQQAFQEFFANKPEQIIEQPTTQCLIVKQ